ncbi:MAG TPA: methyltransferase domain-containing protein [Vicinamibacteria bacterium]
MILGRDELGRYEKQVALVDGCFDPLHAGHITYFSMAAQLGRPLLCNVQDDAYLQKTKGRPAMLPEDQRVEVLAALRDIAHVHLCRTSTADVLGALRPTHYVKGADWKSRGVPAEEQEVCRRAGIEIVYLDSMRDSSSGRASAYLRGSTAAAVERFEQFVSTQRHVDAGHYDQGYFQDSWRAHGNAYTVEARRGIEGKNPVNVRDVFQPRRVLDVGCGPGAMMLFLHELGIEVWGVDISPAAKEMAPAEVRDHIVIAPIDDVHPFDMSFDVVICREVLEHLTVLEIRQAVRTLARYTSKFLYVTTRFHKAPRDLLDVTDDFQSDPTHITAMNKDFLRALFVLEGLRSRPDLERRLDWKNYGRVLVFERPGSAERA